MSEALVQKNEHDPALQFKSQLDTILYTPVTVENISRFADDALEELIALSESVVAKYQKECEDAVYYDGEELEDEAYTHYGLENLNTVLERIVAVRNQIVNITVQVSQSLEQTSTIITPPDPAGPALAGTGNGTYEAPRKLDRLVTLAYILERDFDIDLSSVRYVQGSTTDSMLRQEPYVRVEIEDLNRIVYICDEEGNASYVFDTEILEQLGMTTPELDTMSKNKRNALIRITPTTGRRIIQTPDWRTMMSSALREPFAETETKEPVAPVKVSEFAERAKLLGFDDFVREVRGAYEAAESPGGVVGWYKSERKKHDNWPASPDQTYKNKGWEGFFELVGKEVVEFLEFSDFVAAVRKAYEAAESPRGVRNWYRDEYKKHPGWPRYPQKSYKNSGCESYSGLVGKEVVEFLEFSDFVAAVRKAYEAAESPGGVNKWYQEARLNQHGWPASPDRVYMNKGWMSYPELVGKEVVELLEFNDFVCEVRKVYKAAESPEHVATWYTEEQLKHNNWPVAPAITFKDKGWEGYSKLVGKEVVEFLEFSDFVAAVRKAYEAAESPGGVSIWYKAEYKNYPGWPSNPHRTYINQGWKSYPELVGKEVVEFLEFSDFVAAVRKAYEAAESPRGVQNWYRDEYKKHPGWPAAPWQTYKNKGWEGYSKLVGKEVVEFLGFRDFVHEVNEAYEAAESPRDVNRWYQKERKNHLGWPSSPDKYYKNRDWKSYTELVEK